MNAIAFTLLTDGSSDRCLLPLLTWLIETCYPEIAASGKWADLSILREKPKGLIERIQRAVEFYPCDVLFVHRDAEWETRETRVEEISSAARDAGQDQLVCVVPVRMTEAWLLMDEHAIRLAAGNPNGKTPLGLPRPTELENIRDPKDLLYRALRTASSRRGRRLTQFRVNQAVHRILNYMSDFSMLRKLSAFQALEAEISEPALDGYSNL